jgi:Flp pilus assembly protein TadG
MANRMIEIPLHHSRMRKRCGKWKTVRGARRDDAQSIVELALLMPLFLLLLLGSTEFAHFAWAAVLASNAARAGASFGAVSITNAANLAGIQAAAAADSVNITGLTTTRTRPCACSDGTAIQDCTNSLASCPSPKTIINYVQVNTTVTVTPLGRYAGLPTSFTATGQSIMVVAP